MKKTQQLCGCLFAIDFLKFLTLGLYLYFFFVIGIGNFEETLLK